MSMDNGNRFCTECGSPLEEGAAFCTECGTPVAGETGQAAASSPAPARPAAAAQVTPVYAPSGQAAGRSSKTPLIIAVVIAGVAVVALIVVLAVVAFGPKAPEEPVQDQAAVQQEEQEAREDEEEANESSARSASNEAQAESRVSNTARSRTEEPPASSRSTASAYILPDSDARYYSAYELEDMSLHDLYLARNEIFARHGRMFNNADLQAYFNEQPWYRGVIAPSDFDESVFNDYERKNAQLMLQIEQDQNSPYLNP